MEAMKIRQIDEIFHHWSRGVCPGGQVLARQGGETVYEACFGYADVENRVKITPETVFHAASVSKQFTVMLVELLALDGLVDLEGDIRDYVPEYVTTEGKIAVKDLMSNCSGLRDFFEVQDLMGISNDDIVTQDFVLRLNGRQKGVNFPARSKYSYCNTNFSLLAAIAEKVTGKDFAALLKERILQPLGMEHSQVHDRYWLHLPGRACSYADNGTEFHYDPLVYGVYGGTCLNTTARDLARWMDNYRQGLVCPQAVIDEMSTPAVLSDNAPTTYGRGLWAGKLEGRPYFMHVGEDAGFRTVVFRMPEDDVDVIILSNTDNTPTLPAAQNVARILLGLAPAPVAQSAPTAAALSPAEAAGFYFARLPASGCFTIVEREGQLFWKQRYGLAPLTPVEGNLYRVGQLDAWFLLGSEGARYITAEDSTALTRAGEGALPEEAWADCCGRYLSPELDTVYTVSFREGKLYLEQLRRGESPLHPVDDGSFVTEYSRSCFVRFVRDGGGRVTGLTMTGTRVTELPFEKL